MKENVSRQGQFETILCGEKHVACKNQDWGKYPMVELVTFSPIERMERLLDESVIIYIHQGSLGVSYEEEERYNVNEGKLFLLPLGFRVVFQAENECSFLSWRIKNMVQLCESFRLESLNQSASFKEKGLVILEANHFLRNFFDFFISLIEKGMRCIPYLENKLSELLTLMQAFYSQEDLSAFFSPLLMSDASFKQMILKLYSNVRTVEELAERTNCSLSSFHLRFKNVIGKTPLVWMNEEKAKQVQAELKYTNKPIKQIGREQGFSSVSYFHTFCRKHLGATPTQIRKGLKKEAKM